MSAAPFDAPAPLSSDSGSPVIDTTPPSFDVLAPPHATLVSALSGLAKIEPSLVPSTLPPCHTRHPSFSAVPLSVDEPNAIFVGRCGTAICRVKSDTNTHTAAVVPCRSRKAARCRRLGPCKGRAVAQSSSPVSGVSGWVSEQDGTRNRDKLQWTLDALSSMMGLTAAVAAHMSRLVSVNTTHGDTLQVNQRSVLRRPLLWLYLQLASRRRVGSRAAPSSPTHRGHTWRPVRPPCPVCSRATGRSGRPRATAAAPSATTCTSTRRPRSASAFHDPLLLLGMRSS
jgi:hypothetical protein